MHHRKEQFLKVAGHEPATLDELAHAVIAVANTYRNRRWSGKGRAAQLVESGSARVVGLSWDLRWSDEISNTHNAPVGEQTNWGQEKNKPRGFPGWIGRVWIRYANESNITFGSEPLNATLTHTGTGGGGGYNGPWAKLCTRRYTTTSQHKGAWPNINCYSWDYRIFAQDFPLIQEAWDKELMWAKLSNTRVRSHRFDWEDPRQVIEDCKMVAKYSAELA